MSYEIAVENIKCGGCAATIRNKLTTIEGVSRVEVDVDNGLVTIEGDESHRLQVVQQLLHLGYPESGTAEGIRAATARAKSFVSCAIGRIDNATGK